MMYDCPSFYFLSSVQCFTAQTILNKFSMWVYLAHISRLFYAISVTQNMVLAAGNQNIIIMLLLRIQVKHISYHFSKNVSSGVIG